VRHFKIFLKKFLNHAFYVIKYVISRPETKILQTVDNPLPKRILFQHFQILLHQLYFFIAFHKNQVPQVKQTQLLKTTVNAFTHFVLVKTVKKLT